MKISRCLIAGAISAAAVSPAWAQDLRAQCTAQNATEVFRKLFAEEIRNSPVYAQVLSDANAAPIKAAINDCQAGREGGGRAGMERWISIPQNRQFYVQVIINPALAQSPQLRRQIETAYQEAFGRPPSGGEMDFWAKDPRALYPAQMIEAHRGWLRGGNEVPNTITRSYQEVFKRVPSAEELKFWTDQIRSRGFTYAELVNTHRDYLRQNPGATSLANSPDWRRQLEATYQQAFGRAPSQGEVEFWAKDPRASNQAQILAAHRDFLKAGNEVQDTVTRSYQEVFKRVPSADEMRFWSEQIRSRGFTFAEVVGAHRDYLKQNPGATSLANSPEWRRQLEATYQQAFGRAPSQGEIDFWAKDPRASNQAQILASHRDFLKGGGEVQNTVTRSYQEVFKRAPSADEMRFWSEQIRSRGFTFAEVVGAHRDYLKQNPGALNPAPAAPPPQQQASNCAQGFYVFDGTNNGSHQSTIMYHMYTWAKNAPGCQMVKRYYAGIGDAALFPVIGLATGWGIDRVWGDAVADICQDMAGRTSGAPLQTIGVLGFSRGAMAAVSVVNHLARSGCNVGGRFYPVAGKISFIALSDAVRTSLGPNWPDNLEAQVPHRIQVIKTQYASVDPQRLALWTHKVGNIPVEELQGMEHVDMNCFRKVAKVGGFMGQFTQNQDQDVPNSRYVEQQLVATAQRAGFQFVEPRRRSGICPVDDPGAVERLIQVLK